MAQEIRRQTEIRPIGIDMGISYSASGSSYITLGDTMVKACVNVPRPCGKRLLQEVGILSIEVRYSKPHIPSSSDADLRHVLTELFERHVILSRYPRQLIEAWVTIEEDAGGLFGACVTALSLAFADCGIQMLDILAATSVFAYELDGILTVAVDLSSEQVAAYKTKDPGITQLHLAHCPNLDVVAYLMQTGQHSDEAVIQQMLTLARAGCNLVFNEIKAAAKGYTEWLSEQAAQDNTPG
ncbi:3' exoribonuclease family domain 1 protein [Babesia bovis T2Bo]|uniref:3' exoribonuclease family domain 1 protein n=1 Tax=Babesia bovis T2Bo TaxID=484906 RepID=UPI001C367687|nr:3' exoribonuclease family domain 1 protein [Babesia bovis T2Bo]EDO08733.2 3' exoribonuclease family domain 1 protein [Babesia bovis T2Bo]